MLIDFNSNLMYIFINSKDSRNNYTMNGYAYRSLLDNIGFSREIVFSGNNWGWSPYFTYDNQVLAVQHFSYAGYYAMTSTRNSNGTWSTQRVRSIRPEDFDAISVQTGDVLIIGGSSSISSYPTCPDDHHPHMIDLGLPSGTLWSCCNVGATTPEAYGGYYAWGETEEKDFYDWSNYIHCDDSSNTCYDIGNDIARTQYDVAHVKWGGSWVMPTKDQFEELISNCTYTWTTINDVNGNLFTGLNGGNIFMPAAGYHTIFIPESNGSSFFLPAMDYRQYNDLYEVGCSGDYWSSTLNPSYPDRAYSLSFFDLGGWCNDYEPRIDGISIRPVASK